MSSKYKICTCTVCEFHNVKEDTDRLGIISATYLKETIGYKKEDKFIDLLTNQELNILDLNHLTKNKSGICATAIFETEISYSEEKLRAQNKKFYETLFKDIKSNVNDNKLSRKLIRQKGNA